MMNVIEAQLVHTIDPEGIDYIRLVRHIRYTIERVLLDEKIKAPIKIASLLKTEYPICYNLSWKLIKMIQQTLQKPLDDAEAVYLTMHLQRLNTKIKS